ncbi:MAG: HNH endonuclease [Pseudomonadales bacterium]|nr:HNH endonuclease [Pseudomonadales bacterium]
MRYWWVNQNQTFRQETEGGYLWSPKRNASAGRNPFYEFMREVAPGDFIFSFESTHIRAIGIAGSYAYESPKPAEFGNAGPNWNTIGWRVDARFVHMDNQIRPVEYMDRLAGVLPPRYSPLQANGRGNQGVYLTFVAPAMANILINLIGAQAVQLQSMFNTISEAGLTDMPQATAIGLAEWEEHLMDTVRNNSDLPETERQTLIMARRGQGIFKQNVMQIESQCRITKVDRIEHLRASHIKPWRDCEDSTERLSAANGLLLTPTIDHLFDRGFISFENNGSLLISPAAHQLSLQKMGIDIERPVNVGVFSDDQRHFLDYHREDVFLEARVNR